MIFCGADAGACDDLVGMTIMIHHSGMIMMNAGHINRNARIPSGKKTQMVRHPFIVYPLIYAARDGAAYFINVCNATAFPSISNFSQSPLWNTIGGYFGFSAISVTVSPS